MSRGALLFDQRNLRRGRCSSIRSEKPEQGWCASIRSERPDTHGGFLVDGGDLVPVDVALVECAVAAVMVPPSASIIAGTMSVKRTVVVNVLRREAHVAMIITQSIAAISTQKLLIRQEVTILLVRYTDRS